MAAQLRVRGDLGGTGKKHGDGKCKERTLGQRTAAKKLKNLVHLRIETGKKRKNHMTHQPPATIRARRRPSGLPLYLPPGACADRVNRSP